MKVQLMKLMGHQKKKFSINFTKGNTKFCLSLHYNANGNFWEMSFPKKYVLYICVCVCVCVCVRVCVCVCVLKHNK